MSVQGARVIDLEKYRQSRRGNPTHFPGPAVRGHSPTTAVAPVVPVVWIPVWAWVPLWPMQ